MKRRQLLSVFLIKSRFRFSQDRLLSATAPGEATADVRTCLYDFHVSHGGKMVPFAGFSMPVQYKDLSIIESHLHTRNHVSMFDVSHMLQSKIIGKDRKEYLETLVTADVLNLKPNTGTLTIFTNDHGGIKDDLIVTNVEQTNEPPYLYVVSNAGCLDKDLTHMTKRAEECRSEGMDVHVEPLIGRGLIAVQGPEMMQLLQPGISVNLRELYFMRSTFATVYGIPHCRITRCGYTGEDGVEISVDANEAMALAERLLKAKAAKVRLAGLGARDTLRLEAGLCLYGNDIDENRTPIEAGLSWLIAKRRRETVNFPGAAIILKQIQEGTDKKRVGIICGKGRPARHGATIHDPESGNKVGFVTSGCPSPCLSKNIAMGYVKPEFASPDSQVKIDVSGKGDKMVDAAVTKMPFVKTTYYVPKKTAGK